MTEPPSCNIAMTLAGLVLLCLALWLPGFATLPVLDRDEARYAQASRQMADSGDYIDIRFQDRPRRKKPAGIYWLQATSARLTGAADAIWAYRLPSLLSAVAAVLLMARLALEFAGPALAFAGGALLAGSWLLGVEARVATTDAALLTCTVAALWALAQAWRAHAGERPQTATWEAAVFWVALACGVLVKGPLILAFASLAAGVLSAIARSARWLSSLRPGWGIAMFLTLVLPWFIAISLRSEGGFWVDSLQHDFLAKAQDVQESHGAPPGAYLLSLLLTMWPWTALLLPAAWVAWRRWAEPRVQFCLAWALPTWVLFELAPTKLPHYVLPLFPPLLLLVLFALRDSQSWPHALHRWTAALWITATAAIGIALACVPLAVGEPVSWPVLCSGLLVPLVMAVYGRRAAGRAPTISVLLPALAIVNVAFWAFMLPGLQAPWITREAAALVAANRPACAGSLLAAGYEEPSLVFTLGTPTLLGTRHLDALDPARCHLLLLTQEAEIAVRARSDPRRLIPLGIAQGINYSTGRAARLTLLRMEPPSRTEPLP